MKNMEERVNKKMKLQDPNASSTGYTKCLPLCELDNKQMGMHIKENIKLVEVDDVLDCVERKDVAAIKWLQLHHLSKTVPLSEWNKKLELLKDQKRDEYKEGSNVARVKETVYYPLLLPFFTAAALGQDNVAFLKQNYSKPAPREDIVGIVDRVAECPTEVKLVTYAPVEGSGISANLDAFAGLAQCLSKIAGTILIFIFSVSKIISDNMDQLRNDSATAPMSGDIFVKL